VKRNLIYHVYPHASNKEWRLNVKRLARSWARFNGRKIVGVALDDQTLKMPQVRKAFPDDPSIEWMVAQNDANRGEVVTFAPAAEMLRSLDPDEFTFYAHAKGTSPQWHKRTARHRLYSIRQWRKIMYDACLPDDPGKIDHALRLRPCCGSFKIYRHYRSGKGDPPIVWCYAGTFFWYNHAFFYSHPHHLKLSPDRFAVEDHLGQLFPVHQAVCLAVDECECGIYDWPKEKWKEILAA